MTVTQRNTLVTNQLQTALGAEKAAAVTAALEVANEWLASDSAFRQCLRQRYDELAALIPVKAVKELGPVPIPIKGGGIDSYGPYAKYDPYRLVEDYGRDQLRAVLVRATQKRLREGTDIVQARNPGTKPTSRSSNDAMIEYIMQHVAGSGY